MITGPGWANTTRTSTPKSLSFFSIMRLVISSVSGATVSWRDSAPSSRSTCGRRLSGNSTNKGFCRSLAARSLRGVSTSTGSIMSGRVTGCAGPPCSASSDTSSSRSRVACWPIARSCATSRCSRRNSTCEYIQAPKRSASSAQEKPNTKDKPSSIKVMPSKAEPVAPNHCSPKGPSQ